MTWVERRPTRSDLLVGALAALLACTGSDEVPDPPPPLPDACEAPTIADSADTASDSGLSGTWLLDCAVQDVPELVTARRLSLTLAEPGAVRLCCVHQQDPTEAHVVSSASATEHTLILQGLLPETNYECLAEVETPGGLEEVVATLSTDPPPSWVRLPELSGDPASSDGAYTLVNHFVNGKAVDEQKLLILDRDGGLRWYMDLRDDITSVDATWLGDDTLLYGGGFGGPPRIVDLDQTEVFQAPGAHLGGNHHHDTEPLPSGRIASLVTTRDSADGQEWTGFGVEVIEVPSGELVWSYDSQTGVDAGELPPGTGDPWHANALQVVEQDGELAEVWVNLRDINQLIRIDPATSRIVETIGPGGDYQLLDERGNPAPDEDWFDFPHAPELSGDTVLFYDNRNNQPDSDTSRAVRFTLDRSGGSASTAWSWTERHFREQAWGDVDTLPGGHVLVTIAHCEHCEHSDDKSRSSLVEVDPDSGEVVWRLTWPEATDGLYRADRFGGCEGFANARYCPSVLSE